ncbi:MAG TPA: hypothetical protein VM532_06120 [Burkholderiales bacterium]|nr:hypothetical protein [Burkholderiales bacterium]
MSGEIMEEVLKAVWRQKDLQGLVAAENAFQSKMKQVAIAGAFQIDPPPNMPYPPGLSDVRTRAAGQTAAVAELALNRLNQPNLNAELQKVLLSEDLPQAMEHFANRERLLLNAQAQQVSLSVLLNTPQPLTMEEARTSSASVQASLGQAIKHQDDLLKKLDEVWVRQVSNELVTSGILAQEDVVFALHQDLTEAKQKGADKIEETVIKALGGFAPADMIRAAVYENDVRKVASEIFKTALNVTQMITNQCTHQISSTLPAGVTLRADSIGKPGDRILLPPIVTKGNMTVCELNPFAAGASQGGSKTAIIVSKNLLPDLPDLGRGSSGPTGYTLKEKQVTRQRDGSPSHEAGLSTDQPSSSSKHSRR